VVGIIVLKRARPLKMKLIIAVGSFLALCFGLVLSNPVYQPKFPNGPHNRRSWRDGFDIFSDYTNNSIIPPGKLVEVISKVHGLHFINLT